MRAVFVGMFKRRILFASVIALGVDAACTPTTMASSTPAWQKSVISQQMNVDGEQVNEIRINVQDSHISVRPVVANHRFGTTQSLAGMAAGNGAIAAINGTFFNSWSNLFPDGTIEINGQFATDAKGTLLGIGPHGKLFMTRAAETLTASVQDRSNPISQLWPWYLNVPSQNADKVDILTPYFGQVTSDASANVVVVKNHTVQSIHHGTTAIPSDGFAIEIGSGATSLLNRIHVGDPAQYSVTVRQLNGGTVDFSQYPNAIGAGPMLVNDKQIVLNPVIEGFTDPTLINTNTRRSFIGIDAKGELVLGTIHSATLSTEAKIAKNLGLTQAMNMDGGSSSGLYLSGKYVASPGRKLSNALIVSYQ